VALPSLTRITMLLNVLAAVGVPESWPVAVLNVAHVGLLSMLNASASLFASLAAGVKVYAVPTFAVVAGVPEIVGAAFTVAVPLAAMLKAGCKDAEVTPSVTMIMMLDVVPAAVGVPLRRPVVVLNVAQVGLLRIENVSALPSGSLAAGWNEYADPTLAVVDGVPLIVGDLFAFGFTVSEYAGSDTFVVPSETEMTMLDQTLACSANGVPHSCPVAEENDAQAGRFAMENVSLLPSASVAFGVKLYDWPTVIDVTGVPVIFGAAACAAIAIRSAAGNSDHTPLRRELKQFICLKTPVNRCATD
jgi:hypothetical protein